MSTFMGYRNYDAVLNCGRRGKLSRTVGKTYKLNELATIVLSYMALRTIDKEDKTTQRRYSLPYRTYWCGWEPIIIDHGMALLSKDVVIDSFNENADMEAMISARRTTAVNRISRAAKFLEQQGLIRQVLKPNVFENRNAVWALLISDDDEENLADLNQSRRHYGLPPLLSLDD